jgi:CelD/BcsL family acetyltransferase involved in cellulose biosynthesis
LTDAIALPLRVGARTVARVKRRLVPVSVSLEQALAGEVPELAALAAGADGYLIRSLPADQLQQLTTAHSELRTFVRQRYRRSYASLEGGWETYLGTFSAKARSTLKRKVRKLAERSGGALDLRPYRSAAEMDQFYRHARTVSAKTYQERLLNAGLPEGDAFLGELRQRARQDAMRGWVLFLGGEPVSYLYAPAEGATLIYAFLGYDPDHAAFSPGTVLQFEAMRQLIEEGRFSLFDFTEGEGQHKLLFGTGMVECVDLLLVRPTLANLAVGNLLNGFDDGVAGVKRIASALRLEKLARTFTR